LKYRREIDGLRALAVLPVILFHAGVEKFSGGFVGVDVFFVISGYLITTILADDIENRRFSLLDFYDRRARRILPALFFVMLCCIPFAWMWMTPNELENFGQSLVATTFFSNNVLLLNTSGYWGFASEVKPLLHTWSLAVEEQYYIVFPILLASMWRLGSRNVLAIISLLAIASILLSEWVRGFNGDANFYLAPTRAWEILTGSICAFIIKRKGINSNELLSSTGFLLVITAIFTFDELTPMPSIYALMPVSGVALIILYGDSATLTGKLLGIRALVGLGLVSYSAYLWHQPLFAFARIRLQDHASQEVFLTLSLASIVMAYFSWRYIEKPFRAKGKVTRNQVFIFSAIFAGVLSITGLSFHANKGFATRIPDTPEIANALSFKKPTCRRSDSTEASDPEKNVCILGQGTPSLALIGDSHAGALFNRLDRVLKDKELAAWVFQGGFCPPLLNGFETSKYCARKTKAAFETILNNKEISIVILVAEWANYTKGYRGSDPARTWLDGMGAAKNPLDNPRIFSRSLDVTVARLLTEGKRVLIVEPVPEFHHSTYDYIRRSLLAGNTRDEAYRKVPAIPMSAYRERNDEVFDAFYKLNEKVNFIEVASAFCDSFVCSPISNDKLPMFSDFNHVNYYGATKVVDKIILEIEQE
jgi:peptidoglycan/LPS O-acetylase OafA/YrhL